MDPFFIAGTVLGLFLLAFIVVRVLKDRGEERLAKEEDSHRAPKFPPPPSRMPIPPARPRSNPIGQPAPNRGQAHRRKDESDTDYIPVWVPGMSDPAGHPGAPVPPFKSGEGGDYAGAGASGTWDPEPAKPAPVASATMAGIAGLGVAAVVMPEMARADPPAPSPAPEPESCRASDYSSPAPAPSYDPPAPSPAPSYDPPAPSPSPSYDDSSSSSSSSDSGSSSSSTSWND